MSAVTDHDRSGCESCRTSGGAAVRRLIAKCVAMGWQAGEDGMPKEKAIRTALESSNSAVESLLIVLMGPKP